MRSAVTSKPSRDPSQRRWTRPEYYRMAELGWFQGQRAELIEGEVVVLSPQKFEHGQIADRAPETLRALFGPNFWTRMQLPLDLGPLSEPEPDVSVVAGRREDYRSHPTTAILVVEVSDTTLSFDLGDKASLYAKSGIADYWVIDLVRRALHVHRDPLPDPAQRYGFRYGSVMRFAPADSAAPLGLPSSVVLVSDLLR